MKRVATILALMSVLVMSASAFGQVTYGWTISGSSTDPFDNTGTATFGVATKYLHFNCGVGDGMAAAEFAIVPVGINLLAATAINGYLNAGSAMQPLLAVGGCPIGPVAALALLVLDLPGSLFLAPSAGGVKGTVDCQPAPSLWDINWIGYDSSGASPLGKGDPSCQPISVEDKSWGAVKSLYR